MNEAADALDIDRKTLRNWLKRAKIEAKPSPADGRSVVITEKQLERLRLIHAPHRPHKFVIQHPISTPYRPHKFTSDEREQKAKTPQTNRIHSESEMPPRFIGWREWARLHEIPLTTVQKAVDNNKVQTQRGHWKHGRIYIDRAFNEVGQQAAYERWHNSPKFQVCRHCPNHHGYEE